MNVYQKAVAVMGCFSVLISAAGCANKDMVKKDETIAGKEVTAKAPVIATKAESVVPKREDVKIAAPIVPATTVQQPAKTTSSQAFEKIYFNFDSSELSKEARDALTRNEEILMNVRKDVNLKIEGHCDERGSAEYNLALGERRAKAAAKYLVTMGVKPERLSTIGYGKERPAVQGNDETAWSKNRRDEFVIVK